MPNSSKIILPAKGAAHWISSGDPPGGLLYLGWGRRRYGLHPIAPITHQGWSYMVVLAGHPVVVAGKTERKMKPGNLLLAGPDVPFGWKDDNAAISQLLVWVWQAPPQIENLPSSRRRLCWIRAVRGESLDEISTIHAATRREIALVDSHSPRMLATLQVRLNVEFLRAADPDTDSETRDARRIRQASEWIDRNLDLRSPTASMADYLGVSVMTLNRLFSVRLGLSPGGMVLQRKMREATRLLAKPGATVKAVAFDLGYRHPGDFTRAFSKFHGQSPSGFQARALSTE